MKHLLLTVTAALLLVASGVHAHSHLEKSLPANNSVVTTSPTEIKLHFSTVVRLTSITIQKDGEKEQRLRPASAAAAKTATAPVSLLLPGKYLVAWHAVGEDGHAVTGKLHFTVTNERDLKKDARAEAAPSSRAQGGNEAVAIGTAKATARAFHAALSSGDERSLLNFLDPKVVIMESGHVERSREEYSAHHLAADLKYMKGVTYRLDREHGETIGDSAWVASEARFSDASGGKAIDTISMETLVLKKFSAGWKITHVHWSSRPANKK